MKKFLILILALVLVFGLSVPAMAFTSDDTENEDHPYDLSIYLVEYDDNDLFGFVALPESDRGYAKNEIVAAVVELYVPDDEEILFQEYSMLVFGGENVDLDVADNYDGAHDIDLQVSSSVTELLAAQPNAFTLDNALNDDEIQMTIGTQHGFTGEETYKWLFFAKVTDDDASLYAKLIDGDGSVGFEEEDNVEVLLVTLSGTDYEIEFREVDADNFQFGIFWSDDDGDYVIFIDTDDNYKSTGMSIGIDTAEYPTGPIFPLGVNTDGELGIVKGAIVDTSGDDFDDVMDIYEDVVVDVFGMDYFLIGHYVRKSFFEDLVSADTIIATVDIEPWTAYVSVPDNIVVDPPKTGDAASIMGFVMVALAGSSAITLRKRG